MSVPISTTHPAAKPASTTAKKGAFPLIPTIIIAGVAAGSIATVAVRMHRATVTVVEVTPTPATSLLAVSGEIESVQRAVISSSLPTARVLQVLVDKGNSVRVGQPVVTIDSQDLQAVLRRTEAAVVVAQAEVAKARANAVGAERTLKLAQATLSDVVELRTARDNARASVQTAQERLKQARESRVKIAQGQRDEEVRVAESNLRSAEATMQLRQLTYNRNKSLVESGAIAQSQFDDANLQLRTAQESVRAAQQQLVIARRPRIEDVAVARAAENEAAAALAGAKTALRNAQSALNSRLVQRTSSVTAQTQQETASAEIGLALASLGQAIANRDEARANLDKAVLRSPISGVVFDRMVEPGESAPTGQALLRLTTRGSFRAKADVEEKFLPLLHVGQKATIGAQGIPDLRLPATISEINRAADNKNGTIEARFRLLGGDTRLRPGLTLDINIETDKRSDAITIPRSALIRDKNTTSVYICGSDNVVQVRPISLGRPTDTGFLVESGLQTGERVLTDPRGVKVGESVTARKAKS